MRGILHLFRSSEGSVLTEMAIVAPVALAMMFGVIEASRLFWIRQTLDEVAYSTARCMSVSSACATTAQQKAFAVSRAGSYGITLTNSAVTPQGSVSCNGEADSNQVAISRAVASPLEGFVPAFPHTLSATACFPAIS